MDMDAETIDPEFIEHVLALMEMIESAMFIDKDNDYLECFLSKSAKTS